MRRYAEEGAGSQASGQSTARPIPLLIADAVAVSPIWIGCCASLVLAGVNAVAARLSPEDALVGLEPAPLTAFFCLLFGYLLAAAPLAANAARRDLEALVPILRTPHDLSRLVGRLVKQRRSSLVAAAIGGVFMAFLFSQVGRGRVTRLLEPGGWCPYDASVLLTTTLMWILAAQTLVMLVNHSRLFRSVGADLVRVDLFDLRPLRPFTRAGLRVALLLLLAFAFRLLVLAFEGPYGLEVVGLVASALVAGVCVAVVGLLLPVSGIHRGICAAKEAELDRIAAALAGAEGALEGSSVPMARSLHGTQILEYRKEVIGVAEWPFDAPAIVRFLFYLAIPLFSWVGGAMVERGLAFLLD